MKRLMKLGVVLAMGLLLAGGPGHLNHRQDACATNIPSPPKGTLVVGTVAAPLTGLVLGNSSNANTLTLQPGTTSPSSYTLTWPAAAPGGAGDVLTGGTGGALAFTAPSALGVLPSQTGNSGDFLTTNGSSVSWAALSASSVGLGNVLNAAQVQLQATTPGTAQTGNLNISGTGVFTGGINLPIAASTLTLTVHTSNVVTTVNNAAVSASSQIFLFPTNAAAAASTLQPYISAKVAGTSFSVTAIGALGSETFNYLIVN